MARLKKRRSKVIKEKRVKKRKTKVKKLQIDPKITYIREELGKKCYGTIEYRKTSPICRRCRQHVECETIKPKMRLIKDSKYIIWNRGEEDESE
jgi:hypothetical protein